MNKFLPWAMAGLTIVGMLVSGLVRFGIADDKIKTVSAKVEELDKAKNETKEAMVEQRTDIKYIKGDVAKMSDTLKEILVEVKKVKK